jgi:primosomal protein N' (replication factor Y)
MKRPFVEVAIPVAVEGTFTYRIPSHLNARVQVGSRLLVPWGPKQATAFALALRDEAPVADAKIREVIDVLDDEPALVGDILELCRWGADYYAAPLGEMLRVALPSNMSAASKRRVRVIADSATLAARFEEGEISQRELDFIARLRDAKPAEMQKLLARSRDTVSRLRELSLIAVEDELKDRAGVRLDRYVVLDSPPSVLPPKQQAVVDLLLEAGGTLPYSALIELGASGSAVSTLAKRDVVKIEKRPRQHGIASFVARRQGNVSFLHTAEQRTAISSISAAMEAARFEAFLLQGVTGSGKTEVYLELLTRAVHQQKRQAIFLVPEISLTPAVAARLQQTFGERVAILHSNLSPGEKYEQWMRARRGEVDVAVGPRSALFTPFERLGLLIVDEEGDAAYKQDENPRYNARDLAVVRASLNNIPIVLGSATPSLESRENAESGKYTLLTMRNRVEERGMPEVEIVDLRRERGEREDRGLVIFSSRLVEELRNVIDKGEQAIILMNRRGYAPYLLCRECEHDFRCRDCSVTLTVHRRAGLLMCHYCGFRRPIPPQCPECQGEVLQPIGFGTEKVEERFRKLFPGVPLEVVDRDSTRRKGELVRILDAFREGKARVLIGTQMISKGHDFPNVTLTGVINADAILGYPDFRSAEKTFYLLTQVAGRAGRGERPGKVLIQSGFPGHYAVQLAAQHDYDGFYKAEIEFRKRFQYPPMSGMIAVLLRAEEVEAVERVADEVGRRLEAEVQGIADVRIQGPAPAPLSRIKGVYRFQILARSQKRAALRRAVQRAVAAVTRGSVDIVIDVDPINIL